MKSVSIPLVLLFLAFSVLAHATPVTARYLRFDGYYSSNTGQIDIYEIEAYANWQNVARNATVTVNSGTNVSRLIDGNLTSTQFSTSRTNPGPASEEVPHWIRLDFGSVQPIERIQVYLLPNPKVSFGLFLSNDGVSWTQVGRYDEVSGMIQNNPSGPFVIIQSAEMRPGTTLMDVVYRVNDPDDATVKTRALAFVGGVRSFANVIRPVTFVEGTAANLGDAIPANVDHTLTWDVGTDWDIDLGQVKFEVLAMDSDGLLPTDWITIPPAGGEPELTISKEASSNMSVLSALFWLFSDGDPGLVVENGILRGSAVSGNLEGVHLVTGTTVNAYSTPFIFKRMNLDPLSEVAYAVLARAGMGVYNGWHAVQRPYSGIEIVYGWGDNSSNNTTIPPGLSGAIAIASGNSHSLALRGDGTVYGWGQILPPQSLSGITAISISGNTNLALKDDGTVVGWGDNYYGQTTIPLGLRDVIAVAAGSSFSLALKTNGTVVAWGSNNQGQTTVPPGLDNVIAIAAGFRHGLALKSNGTVVGWGHNDRGQVSIPSGLSGVTDIGAAAGHSIARKSNGTVVGWGDNYYGQRTIPIGLSGVIAIATGSLRSLALKEDGTVVQWGHPVFDTDMPNSLRGISSIFSGTNNSFAIKAKAP